jgi:hypothetical protein
MVELAAELTPHVLERMVDRSFTQVELRGMLERALGSLPDVLEGRFVIETGHASRPWHVILEPDEEDRLLVAITAYPVERS